MKGDLPVPQSVSTRNNHVSCQPCSSIDNVSLLTSNYFKNTCERDTKGQEIIKFKDRFNTMIKTICTFTPQPIDIHYKIKVSKIACGFRHSLLLTENGTVIAFGDNTSG